VLRVTGKSTGLCDGGTGYEDEQQGGEGTVSLHGGAQYIAKQLAQSKLKFRNSRPDPTFGGFQRRHQGIKCSFSMANH
jgi:hypothetical protein